MRLRAIRIRNFRLFRDAEMKDIPAFAVLIGANGTGKTTFIDVFGFLRDCLVHNVRTAVQKRAGFQQLLSRGQCGQNIEINLKVRLGLARGERTVTYRVEIGERDRRPAVRREVLSWTRGAGGKPFRFIDFEDGRGDAVEDRGDTREAPVPEADLKREFQELDAPDILAIKGLGQFRRFEAATQLRELIEGWTVSDFHIADARAEPDAAPAEHLSATGDNLALFAQFLRERHPALFDDLVRKMAERVPGIAEVIPEEIGDGRIGLRFRDAAFDKGFIARAVSDGTIKMFAYLALLHDPDPHPLLCIEEPENQLYPKLLPVLAEEFAAYAQKRSGGAQVFVTTHSPDFLSSVPLESIYWLRKEHGFSTVHRASDDGTLKRLIAEGETPGALWRQGWFGSVDPQ